MKVQLSLEFLVYAAVSAASLAVALSLFAPYYASMREQGNAALFGEFVSALNYAIGMREGSFAAIVPYGICNATSGNWSIVSRYGTFMTEGNVSISGELCGEQGRLATIGLGRATGGYVVG